GCRMVAGPRMADPPAPAWTIESLLRWAMEDFRGRGIESPRLDAEVLLARALGTTRIQLIVDAKRPLAADELARMREMVRRRRSREPVAYILGEREFYGRTFRVDRRVLVPRPDTETLVDVALARTRARALSLRVLDLCTGSGCVAVTLGRERPTTHVFGGDVSPDALAVARDNARRLGAYNVAFREGDLYAAVPLPARFDLVTANPPYVVAGELASLQVDVRDHEPRLALDGGADGLALLARVVAEAPARLVSPGGVLAVEVGAGQAPAVAQLFEAAGFAAIEVQRDYARIERVVSGMLRGS
ncbi:MAG TPA: peptide chain release factor N(5)-glutamine methyltransferase, partial [Polyangiaceae bacterium]|nr:peptide chain release factor N(5)-glutamine methyltransferase [Polyangiaceae bacterium]